MHTVVKMKSQNTYTHYVHTIIPHKIIASHIGQGF